MQCILIRMQTVGNLGFYCFWCVWHFQSSIFSYKFSKFWKNKAWNSRKQNAGDFVNARGEFTQKPFPAFMFGPVVLEITLDIFINIIVFLLKPIFNAESINRRNDIWMWSPVSMVRLVMPLSNRCATWQENATTLNRYL